MQLETKPLATKLGWDVLESCEAYKCPWFTVQQHTISRGGHVGTYTYVEHPGSVFVVPITTNGDVVLIRSYRFTSDSWSWEIPAGTLGDKPGFTPFQAASMELREELGATASGIDTLGTFYVNNGSARHVGHVFLARDITICSPQRLDPFEQIEEIRHFTWPELLGLIATGFITDAESALALLFAYFHVSR